MLKYNVTKMFLAITTCILFKLTQLMFAKQRLTQKQIKLTIRSAGEQTNKCQEYRQNQRDTHHTVILSSYLMKDSSLLLLFMLMNIQNKYIGIIVICQCCFHVICMNYFRISPCKKLT